MPLHLSIPCKAIKRNVRKLTKRANISFWIKNYKTEWEILILISNNIHILQRTDYSYATHYCLSTLLAGAEKLLLIKKENLMERTHWTIRESFRKIMFAQQTRPRLTRGEKKNRKKKRKCAAPRLASKWKIELRSKVSRSFKALKNLIASEMRASSQRRGLLSNKGDKIASLRLMLQNNRKIDCLSSVQKFCILVAFGKIRLMLRYLSCEYQATAFMFVRECKYGE